MITTGYSTKVARNRNGVTWQTS